jgi:hypothetical protein
MLRRENVLLRRVGVLGRLVTVLHLPERAMDRVAVLRCRKAKVRLVIEPLFGLRPSFSGQRLLTRQRRRSISAV